MRIDLEEVALEPGSRLRGVVSGASSPVLVRASWGTTGKGDTDRVVVCEATVFPQSPRFDLQLPLLPLTYNGRLLSISWEVSATCNGEITATQFTLAWRRTP